jgi:hypothetical protein
MNGQILGPKVQYSNRGLTPAAQVFIDRNTRAVLVPARLSPPLVVCMNGKPDRTGSCLQADPNGNFPPLPYLLPAFALSVSQSPSTAIWLMRAACAVPSLVLLLVAAGLLWSGTGWSLLGLLAAISPMVLYSSTILNASGLQISACIAFAGAVLRIARDPPGATRWVWVAFTGSGVVAMLAGPIGLEFALVELVLLGGVLGIRGMRELRRVPAWRVRLSALTLFVGGVLALIYTRVAGFKATVKISPILKGLQAGVDELPRVLHEAVGSFGAESVPLPITACWIWWLLVLVLLAAALWLGTPRGRMLLAAVVVVALAFPVLFYAWAGRFTGFGLQGREVLPVLTLIPLVAGEVLYRNSSAIAERGSARALLGGVIALVAAVQAYAWWYDGRIVAGSGGTTWSPPLGWLPWAGLVALGTAALLAFAAAEAIDAPRPRTAESALSPAPHRGS